MKTRIPRKPHGPGQLTGRIKCRACPTNPAEDTNPAPVDNSPTLNPALYLVATPIGNRNDLSSRARSILESCDRLYCEDKRHASKLLNGLNVAVKPGTYHDHNEKSLASEIAGYVENHLAVALISDAGTPCISDPGFRVVRECHRRGLRVVPVPGPNAAVAALSASGLPSDRFYFFGFLQPKRSARIKTFTQYAEEPATLIFYESVHRIDKAMVDLESTLGPDRVICLARELTKHFESIHTGTVSQVKERIRQEARKGEYVILVAKYGYSLESES